MGEKETILSKLNIKDYRNDLELVLENKAFDEEAKSLLLSVFYKIDNFYKDYQSVKINSEGKNKFLEDYISIIRDKCDEIKILPPQEFKKNSKYVVDKKTGSIKCFPNENVLLFSIFELSENKFDNTNIEFVNKCIIDMLNKGKTINNIEPIRDFNGWSWNVEINDVNNMRYNLIYQNLLILFGYEFINNVMNNENIFDELRKETFQRISRKKVEDFMVILSEIAIGLYNNKSTEAHKECLKSKEDTQNQINALKNRKEYINYVSKNNAILIKQIEKIDMVLNDIDLIRKEFSDSVLNNDGKYFCMSDVVDKYEIERKAMMSKVEENNELLSPKRYLEIQEAYKKRLELYNQVEEEKNKINVQNKIIEFQKIFLECIKLRINKDESKRDLIQIASEMRYYNNIPFEKCKKITLQNGIDSKYEEIIRMLVYAMINDRIIDIGFKNKDFCYKILKYIFDTKIMKLDSIVVKINFKGQSQIEVEYYDGNILDHQEFFNIPFDEEISNRKSRKIKIF